MVDNYVARNVTAISWNCIRSNDANLPRLGRSSVGTGKDHLKACPDKLVMTLLDVEPCRNMAQRVNGREHTAEEST